MKIRTCVTFVAASFQFTLAAEVVNVGAGSYRVGLPEGAKGPPRPVRAEVFGKRVPSNDWWSSLVWSSNTFAQFPHPLAVKVEPGGLRVAYPGANINANKAAIFGGMPGGTNDFVLGHSAAARFGGFVVDEASDWFVALKFTEGAASMRVSYGHGSPFVYATCEGGAMRLTFAKPPQVWSGDANSPVLGITANGHHYGIFAPTGAKWLGFGSGSLSCDTEKNYFSIAVLPDTKPETLALFRQHAYAHVTDTRVTWAYNESQAAVVTGYSVATKAFEGSSTNTLLALYPHQWRNTTNALLSLNYNSVRGKIALVEGSGFTTTMKFPGVLPALPKAPDANDARMGTFFKEDFAKPVNAAGDTYWAGKQMGRLASAIPIAEAYGLTETANSLRQQLRGILENWLTAETNAQPKSKNVFAFEPSIGTLIGFPASYGSNNELNDHHFHYGYFIKAAAEIARRDPTWASDARFGAMIKLLVRDIASPQRNDPLFPFMRCFDPYAGHSWASGHARFGDGNNNESSSEAMNAWCGIILFGEAVGDRELRDLGIYLFTTELNAINEYWFNVNGDNFPSSYPASVVTMVWGGKGANATWFSGDPQMVHGINFLPMHGGSAYLGLFPDYAEKNFRALVTEFGSDQFKTWPDILWMYRALSDTEDAARLMNAAATPWKIEAGNTRANTAHWIDALQAFGRIDRKVTADQPLYAVFRKGATRTYAAYNTRAERRQVTFSDDHVLSAAPNTWTFDSAPAGE